MPYVSTWERMLIQKGKLETILRVLAIKVGELGEDARSRIGQLPTERLDRLSEALLGFTEPQDLEKWLRQHAPKRRRTSGKNARAH